MPGRIVVVVIDAHDRGQGVFGHVQPFGLDLERGGDDDLLRAGLQVAAHRPPAFRRVGGRVLEGAGGIDHQAHLVALPVDILRVASLAEKGDRHAVDGHAAPGLVEVLDHPPTLVAVQVHTQPAVGGVLFDG